MATSPVKPIVVRGQAGIQRDGTLMDATGYVEGRWCRFQRSLPRKMGGYTRVVKTIPDKIYGMRVDGIDNEILVHAGSANSLLQMLLTTSGAFVTQSDRTPAGFAASPNNVWQMDSFYDSADGSQQLIAHAGQSLADITDETELPIYAGPLTANTPLVATGMDPVSGGVLACGPYLLAYGNNGRVDVSPANAFNVTASSSFVTGSKIVKGIATRGTGAGPGAILWSLDSIIRAQFNDPVQATFAFDTLTTESSVLSSQGFVDYDGIFFWAGMDRFLYFNGSVNELENTYNVNWFYDNINFEHRNKCFAYKVPRFGEIWWCFPFGDATECTHAVVFNVREKYWYDTELPSTMRTAGAFAKVYQKPFMCDATADITSSGFSMWKHEEGVNEVREDEVLAIDSYFRTQEFSPILNGGDQGLRIARTEPDFIQTGPLTVRVFGRANARCEPEGGETFTVQDTVDLAEPQTQVVNMKEGHRLMALEFRSNVAGGDFQLGKTLAFVEPIDSRFTGQ